MRKEITIFTPTYNRARLLERIYFSLMKQLNHNFIWLIVDDGSIDNTKKIVENFINERKIEIKYIYQQNGGKHRAHNTAVKECKTDYFFILDSDDYLMEEATEILTQKIRLIENDDKISGIIGNRIDSINFKPIGKEIPNIGIASGNELYQKYNFKGDTLRMYKTSILKENLFPEIENEKFISENVIFDKIDSKYKMLIIKEKIYIGEYQENGYSNNIYKIQRMNPIGYLISLNSSANYSITLKKKIGYTILYMIWRKKMNLEYRKGIEKNLILEILCFPLMYICLILKKPKFFFKNFEDLF